MADRKISFSNEELPIREIQSYFETTEKALRAFYQPNNLYFATYTQRELNDGLRRQINELGKSTALTILASIEAHIIVDYKHRLKHKGKDSISKGFKELDKKKGSRLLPRLDDILGVWKQNITKKFIISEFRGALNYRHWLAHGRYWETEGRRYDFDGLLTLAIELQAILEINMGV